MAHNLRLSTLQWAEDQLVKEIANLADDPWGYAATREDITKQWQQLKSVAQDLHMNPVAILQEKANAWDRARLSEIVGEAWD